ncbi:MAG: site-2 protease family protein [Planctomycetia bacterium]
MAPGWSDDGPTLPRALRWLAWSIPLGRPLGVELRAYVLGLLLLPLLMLPLDWVAALAPGAAVAYVAGGVLVVLLATWLHELGHAWAGRRHGVHTTRIVLSPLGALAHMDAPAPSPQAELRIALAGPATHLAWLALLWPASRLVPWEPSVGPLLLHHAVALHLALLAFNLLPCWPLDGGRVLRSLLARRLHPNRATLWAAHVGIVGAVALGALGVLRGGAGGGLLLALAITNLLACLQARREARHAEGPYGAARAPWEADGEAWKRGTDSRDVEVLEPPSSWRQRRAAAARERAEQAEQHELDALLARVSEVGLAGLSPRERERLARLGEARRRRREAP